MMLLHLGKVKGAKEGTINERVLRSVEEQRNFGMPAPNDRVVTRTGG